MTGRNLDWWLDPPPAAWQPGRLLRGAGIRAGSGSSPASTRPGTPRRRTPRRPRHRGRRQPRRQQRGHRCDTTTGVTSRGDLRRRGERHPPVLPGIRRLAEVDYRIAGDALTGTGRTVAWAEQRADAVIHECRHDLLVLARQLHRHGRAGRPVTSGRADRPVRQPRHHHHRRRPGGVGWTATTSTSCTPSPATPSAAATSSSASGAGLHPHRPPPRSRPGAPLRGRRGAPTAAPPLADPRLPAPDQLRRRLPARHRRARPQDHPRADHPLGTAATPLVLAHACPPTPPAPPASSGGGGVVDLDQHRQRRRP